MVNISKWNSAPYSLCRDSVISRGIESIPFYFGTVYCSIPAQLFFPRPPQLNRKAKVFNGINFAQNTEVAEFSLSAPSLPSAVDIDAPSLRVSSMTGYRKDSP
jgi:hypothetical protein